MIRRRFIAVAIACAAFVSMPAAVTGADDRQAAAIGLIDIMIADLHLPDGPGTISIRSLRSTQPEALVIVTAMM